MDYLVLNFLEITLLCDCIKYKKNKFSSLKEMDRHIVDNPYANSSQGCQEKGTCGTAADRHNTPTGMGERYCLWKHKTTGNFTYSHTSER